MHNIFHPLFDASVELVHFLMHVTRSTKDDPFFTVFNRMIEEEKDISGKVQPNELNLQLVQQLEILLHNYKERMDKIRNSQWNISLSVINDRINSTIKCPMIREQIAAIKQGREITTKPQEFAC